MSDIDFYRRGYMSPEEFGGTQPVPDLQQEDGPFGDGDEDEQVLELDEFDLIQHEDGLTGWERGVLASVKGGLHPRHPVDPSAVLVALGVDSSSSFLRELSLSSGDDFIQVVAELMRIRNISASVHDEVLLQLAIKNSLAYDVDET